MNIFLYVLVICISTALVGVLDIFLFKKKGALNITLELTKVFFLLGLLTPWIMAEGFDYGGAVFSPSILSPIYFLYYFLMAILVGAVYLGIKFLYNKYMSLGFQKREKKGKAITAYVIALILFFLGVLVLTSAIWARATYNGATIDEIIITITSPIDGTSSDIVYEFIAFAAVPSIASALCFSLIFFDRIRYTFKRIDSNNEHITLKKTLYGLASPLVFGGFILIFALAYGIVSFDIHNFIFNQLHKSTYIEDNYKAPEDVELTFSNEKRNLIHIYLESIENSYFDRKNGGNMDENLMPGLLDIANNSANAYSFSHLSVSPLNGGPKGGPLKTNGATWSVASMVNQSFGVPMLVSAVRNEYGTGENAAFYQGAVGIGDILNRAGYNQTMMIGAQASFGGLDNMFKSHGAFKIMDWKYARNHGMTNKFVEWGYVDEDLYRFAKDELTRLAGEDKPFHFVMENADTHFPGFHFEGDKPVYGSKDKNKDYAKTIKFSDYHTSQFIRWIMAQPFYKNTTVVIIGDHLSMDKTFFQQHDFTGFNRTTFNLILNPVEECQKVSEERFYNRHWASYDMMPTLLASIGVRINGNRLGLGTNLFSNEKTLFERDGYMFANSRYKEGSTFYDNVLINNKKDYNGGNLILPPKKKSEELESLKAN